MAEKNSGNSILKCAPFQSSVDEGFWHRLSSLKLNKFGIDDSPIPITGFHAPCSHSQVSNPLTLLAESLPSDPGEPASSRGNRNRCPVPGILYNTNALESFHALDKQRLLETEANNIWEDIQNGTALEDSSVLSRFLLISFADLKKWSFHYWFAFPALLLDPPAKLVDELKPASQVFSIKEAQSVSTALNDWRSSSLTTHVPFFLVVIDSNSCATVKHLKDWETCQNFGRDQKVLFGFYDPSHLPKKPGWPLRNLLALISSRWDIKNPVSFLCYRETRGFADLGLSLVGKAQVQQVHNTPNAEGWQREPKCISLAESMDPTRLAVSAADLNLKLMRWRALPSLNLNTLSSLKCLLLGAGTLLKLMLFLGELGSCGDSYLQHLLHYSSYSSDSLLQLFFHLVSLLNI